jgi:nitrate reductase NapAB chaperone NapD
MTDELTPAQQNLVNMIGTEIAGYDMEDVLVVFEHMKHQMLVDLLKDIKRGT